MATDKTSGKGTSATLEINDKVLAKSKEILGSMLEEVKTHAQKKPAETIVKENIEIIDKLSKSGVSLPKIYERLNKSIPLGISSASFTQYVRNVRKQVGSELYKELGKRKSKKEIKISNAANFEEISAKLESNLMAISKSGFQCEHCEKEAEIYESPKIAGVNFWHCKKCNAFYHDESGKITNKRLEDNSLVDIDKK